MIVLGGGTPLGRRVVAALRREVEVESAMGIEQHPFDDPAMNEGLEFISWLVAHRNPTDFSSRACMSGYDAREVRHQIPAR